MIETIGKPKWNRIENDFYATFPEDVKLIVDELNIHGYTILEPCAGNGHITKELKKQGNKVVSNDLIQRDFILDYNYDFLSGNVPNEYKYDMVLTNPPFKLIVKFILKSFEYAPIVIIFARIQLLESIERYQNLFKKGYLKKIYIYSKRTGTMPDGDILAKRSGSMCFAWFVFDTNHQKDPIIKWINKE